MEVSLHIYNYYLSEFNIFSFLCLPWRIYCTLDSRFYCVFGTASIDARWRMTGYQLFNTFTAKGEFDWCQTTQMKDLDEYFLMVLLLLLLKRVRVFANVMFNLNIGTWHWKARLQVLKQYCNSNLLAGQRLVQCCILLSNVLYFLCPFWLKKKLRNSLSCELNRVSVRREKNFWGMHSFQEVIWKDFVGTLEYTFVLRQVVQ